MSNLVKGIICVILGASSYGMLSTIVKIAYGEGYSTGEVSFTQFLWGIVSLLILNGLTQTQLFTIKRKEVKKLMLAGTSMGFTSVFYYLSVKYINASIAVVLLMQSVWIGVLVEALLTKTYPTKNKLLAVLIILMGTVLATNLFASDFQLNILGLIFGFLAACSFSGTLLSTSTVAKGYPPMKRSFYMLLGGMIIVLIFALLTQILPYYFGIQILTKQFIIFKSFDLSLLFTWGILLALLGTVIPPILLNKGFPLAGVGLGSILSSAELPVAVTFAHLVIGEDVNLIQWLGIALILGAIVLMNYKFLKKSY